MINGVHALLYTKQPDALRAFFRDVLGFRSVDAGQGWLIFGLPPAELGIHPDDDGGALRSELYLMCDDVRQTVADLEAKGVTTGPINDAGWGLVTAIEVSGVGAIGLYQPRHPTALE